MYKCKNCGAYLDAGESCNCENPRIENVRLISSKQESKRNVSMLVSSLRKLINKPVSYKGKPYTLWKIRSCESGYVADLINEDDGDGYRKALLGVPVEEISETGMKWDWRNRRWVERSEQIEIAEPQVSCVV